MPLDASLLVRIAFASCLVACSGRTVSASSGSGVTANGAKTGGAGSPEIDARCNAPGGTEITFANVNDAQKHLVGRWIRCQGPGLPFATEQRQQAGIEFGADMTWYLLTPVDGSLARASGFDASDSYRFQPPQDLDYGPSKGMILFLGAAYSFAHATMLDSPRKLRMAFNTPLDDTPSIYVREVDP